MYEDVKKRLIKFQDKDIYHMTQSRVINEQLDCRTQLSTLNNLNATFSLFLLFFKNNFYFYFHA